MITIYYSVRLYLCTCISTYFFFLRQTRVYGFNTRKHTHTRIFSCRAIFRFDAFSPEGAARGCRDAENTRPRDAQPTRPPVHRRKLNDRVAVRHPQCTHRSRTVTTLARTHTPAGAHLTHTHTKTNTRFESPHTHAPPPVRVETTAATDRSVFSARFSMRFRAVGLAVPFSAGRREAT